MPRLQSVPNLGTAQLLMNFSRLSLHDYRHFNDYLRPDDFAMEIAIGIADLLPDLAQVWKVLEIGFEDVDPLQPAAVTPVLDRVL